MNTPLNLQILIVEDNQTMREGMEQILKNAGYETMSAVQAEAALELVKMNKYDLVITDYKMAGMTGLDLLTRIQTQSHETEVIVITAYGTIDLAVEAM